MRVIDHARSVAAALVGCCSPAAATPPISPSTQGTGPHRACPRRPRPCSRPSTSPKRSAGRPARRRSPAAGLRVNAFATGLDHPRWLLALPNGDVLVAESAAPPPPERLRGQGGLRAMFMRMFMSEAGSAVPSANRITLLRDADGDGVAETAVALPDRPHLAVRHGAGRRHALRRQCRRAGRLPLSGRRDPDRRAAAHGRRAAGRPQPSLDQEPGRQPPTAAASMSASAPTAMSPSTAWPRRRSRAAIWEIDPATGAHRLFASGLRNPVGLDFKPGQRPALWSSSTSATSSAATSSPIT